MGVPASKLLRGLNLFLEFSEGVRRQESLQSRTRVEDCSIVCRPVRTRLSCHTDYCNSVPRNTALATVK